MNIAVLQGQIAGHAERRTLADGHQVVSFDVQVGPGGGAAARVPVSWFDPPGRTPRLEDGDEVLVVGRVRRRFFRSGGSTRARTEVVVERLVSGRSRSAVRRALVETARVVEEGPTPPHGSDDVVEARSSASASPS